MSRNPKSLDHSLAKLAQSLDGTVSTSDSQREIYAIDASMYYLRPKAVVCPKNEEDVIKTVAWSQREKISITARGAGTSTAGQAIGEGIIIDFNRFMNRVLEINAKEGWVSLEPGIVYEKLNQTLKAHQMFFPVNPSSGKICTLGGMLANNASGPYSLKYGSTKDHIINLRVLLADGRLIETENPPRDLTQKLQSLLEKNQVCIQKYRPKSAVNSSGYNVWDALQKNHMHMAQLFVGSEGTLGIITRAKIKCSPLPQAYRTALIGFRSLEDVSEGLRLLRQLKPAALEFIDSDLCRLLRQRDALFAKHFREESPIALFLEFDSNDCQHFETSLTQAKKALAALKPTFLEIENRNTLWNLRQSASPILHEIRGPHKPLKFIEDGAVPFASFPRYLKSLKDFLEKMDVPAAAFGHAGNGHLHINPRLDPRLAKDRKKWTEILSFQTQLVISLGGTISGEHGDGLLRSQALHQQFGELVETFREIKKLLDPQNLLNPGKILNPDAQAPFKNWRYHQKNDALKPIASDHQREPGFFERLDLCHGCAKCRHYCPVFLDRNEEKTTGRAKSQVIRGLWAGDISPADPEVKETLKLCEGCSLCLDLCPTHIDISRLCAETELNICPT